MKRGFVAIWLVAASVAGCGAVLGLDGLTDRPDDPAIHTEDVRASDTAAGDDARSDVATQADADAAKPVTCEPLVGKSRCDGGNAGAMIRGVVRFDPRRYTSRAPPHLVVFMNHAVLLSGGDTTLGGDAHGYRRYGPMSQADLDRGATTFAIDLCEIEQPMYSEESCGFNLVVILDEDGSNDRAVNPASYRQVGVNELATIRKDVRVSCHDQQSPCIELTADCVGASCTGYAAPAACACGTPSCPESPGYPRRCVR